MVISFSSVITPFNIRRGLSSSPLGSSWDCMARSLLWLGFFFPPPWSVLFRPRKNGGSLNPSHHPRVGRAGSKIAPWGGSLEVGGSPPLGEGNLFPLCLINASVDLGQVFFILFYRGPTNPFLSDDSFPRNPPPPRFWTSSPVSILGPEPRTTPHFP